MKLKYDRERILQAVDKIVKKTMQMDMTWDWPCGVAYYGVAAAYERTGREEYLTLLKDRVDELISLGLPQVWTVNTCAMGHCLITLYQTTGEERYWDLVMSKMKYLRTQALRFGDRVLQHTVSPKNDFPEQAWADTLFMAAYLMLRVGVISRDEELVNDALNQWYWHINYLQDPEKGFYYHGYNNISGDHMSGIYWGRANAWAAYTMSRVGWTLPECLSEQLSALKTVQTENGLWRTVLDDEEAYEEISASAGIAAAMVCNHNPLHIRYINKAIEGVLANVGSDGKVLNVSGGTAVMKDVEGYRGISKKWIQGWGQGLALAFLCAVLGCDEQSGDEA